MRYGIVSWLHWLKVTRLSRLFLQHYRRKVVNLRDARTTCVSEAEIQAVRG